MADVSLRCGSASRNELMIVALAENWWAIAIRGALGIRAHSTDVIAPSVDPHQEEKQEAC